MVSRKKSTYSHFLLIHRESGSFDVKDTKAWETEQILTVNVPEYGDSTWLLEKKLLCEHIIYKQGRALINNSDFGMQKV